MSQNEDPKFDIWMHRIYNIIFLIYAPIFIAEQLGHAVSYFRPGAACFNWFPWTLGLTILSATGSGWLFYRRRPSSFREKAWLSGLPVFLALLAIWAGFRPESDPPLRWSRFELRDADGRPRALESALVPFDAVIHGYIRTEQLLKASDNKKLVARRTESGYEKPASKKGEDGRLIGENYIPIVSNTLCRCPRQMHLAADVDAFIGVYVIGGNAPAGQMLQAIDDSIDLPPQKNDAEDHQCSLLVLVFPCTEGSLKKFKDATKFESLIVADWTD